MTSYIFLIFVFLYFAFGEFFSKNQFSPRMIFWRFPIWFLSRKRRQWNEHWLWTAGQFSVFKICVFDSNMNGVVKAFFNDHLVSLVYGSLLFSFQLIPLILKLNGVIVIHFAS